MTENIENLRVETIHIVNDAFGPETGKLFRQYVNGRQAKDILFFLKELLNDYMGGDRAAAIVDGLFIKYKLLKGV